MGGVADGVIEEVNRLANVHDHRDGLAVGMAEAAIAAGAETEYVAVDEREAGFCPYVAVVSADSGVVEPDYHVVAVDQLAVLTL